MRKTSRLPSVTPAAPVARSRRAVLRAGALAALGVTVSGVSSGCTTGFQDGPDPLAALQAAAQADADAAGALARAGGAQAELAKQVATARAAHAAALKSEVDRQNQPKAATATSLPEQPAGLEGLRQRLVQAREQANKMVPDLPRYRAGLAASVAAGCAGLQRLGAAVGPGAEAGPVTAPAGVRPAQETVDAVQRALAAEHAAIWVYGLVSAFLPGDFGKAVKEGAAEHVGRRDACERLLAAAGATPVSPEPAYLPPKPVTDANSAKFVIAVAEADSSAAWLGVVGGTDDPAVRAMATQALIASSRRGTPWRLESRQQPAAVALPGQPAS